MGISFDDFTKPPSGAGTKTGLTGGVSFDQFVSTPRVRDEATFGESFGRGVDIAQGLGFGFIEAVGEATGSGTLTDFGREGRERNIAEAAEYGHRSRIADVRGVGDFLQWVKEVAGEQIPLMAPSMGGAVAGGAAGSFVAGPPGTLIGAAIGAFTPSLVLGAGEVQQNIKERGGEAPGAAFVGGSAIAALDTILPGKIGSTLVRALGREVAEDVAKRTLMKRVAVEAGKGMAVEGVTEAMQEAIGEVAAAKGTGTDIDVEGLKAQMIEAGAAGSLMGGVVSGGAAVVTPQPKPEGARERAAREQPELTPEDRESPLPDDLIAEGKGIFADAEASDQADTILDGLGYPPVGTRVDVTLTDGGTLGGEIVDAFRQENADLGISDDGIKILLDDGTVLEEFADQLRRSGIRITEPSAPGAPAEQGAEATPADDAAVEPTQAPPPAAPSGASPAPGPGATNERGPYFDEFRDLLPTDENGDPDITGAGYRIITEVTGEAKPWKNLTLDERTAAINIARGETQEAPADLESAVIQEQAEAKPGADEVAAPSPVAGTVREAVRRIVETTERGSNERRAALERLGVPEESADLAFIPGENEVLDRPLDEAPAETTTEDLTIPDFLRRGEPAAEVEAEPEPAPQSPQEPQVEAVEPPTPETPETPTTEPAAPEAVPETTARDADLVAYLRAQRDQSADIARSPSGKPLNRLQRDAYLAGFDRRVAEIEGTDEAPVPDKYGKGQRRTNFERGSAAVGFHVKQFQDGAADTGSEQATEKQAKDDAPDIETVVGQGTAKRALEIAAVGGHTVRLRGAGASEIAALKNTFPSITGANDQFTEESADIDIEVHATPGADVALPPPAEDAATIRARVEKARKTISTVSGISDDAGNLLDVASGRGFDAVRTRSVARTLAAMDGNTRIERINVAEALSYQEPRESTPAPPRGEQAPRTGEERAQRVERPGPGAEAPGEKLSRRRMPQGLEADQQTFSEQLDKYLDDPEAWGAQKPLVLGETPLVLEYAGIDRRKLEVVPDVIVKAMEKHAISADTLKNLPFDIADPIYVMHSDPALNPGNVGVLLKSTDQFGENLLIGINPTTGQVNIARIVTAHGRRRTAAKGSGGVGIEKFLERNAEEGRIVYVNRKTAKEWSLGRGIKTPTWATILDRNASVKSEAHLVKQQENRGQYAARRRQSPVGVDPTRFQSAFTEDVGRVAQSLKARLAHVGLGDKIALLVHDDIMAVVDGKASPQDGRYVRGLIEIALSGDRLEWTLNHEIIHGLKDLGVIRPLEWKALERAVLADQGRLIETRQAYPTLNRDAMIEEAVADMFADWAAGRAEPGGALKRAWNRVVQFFKALAEALTGRGYRTTDDIFEAIERGEVAARRQPRDRAGRFVADPDDHIDEPGPMGLSERFAAAYHGSPHDFDRFSTEAIGTGEGDQAYGWGLYFAGKKGVAVYYQQALVPQGIIVGSKEYQDIDDALKGGAFTTTERDAIREAHDVDAFSITRDPRDALKFIAETNDGELAKAALSVAEKITLKHSGRLYKVNLAPAEDEYLYWDKPLSEQSENVQKALKGIPDGFWDYASDRLEERGNVPISPDDNAYDGGDFYQMLANPEAQESLPDEVPGSSWFDGTDPKKHASLYLRSLGIPGVKYLDQGSRTPIQHASIDTARRAQIEARLMELQKVEIPATKDAAALSKLYAEHDALSRELTAANVPEPTYNYVIFDDSLVEVEGKFASRRYESMPSRVEVRDPDGYLIVTLPTRKDVDEAVGAVLPMLGPGQTALYVDNATGETVHTMEAPAKFSARRVTAGQMPRAERRAAQEPDIAFDNPETETRWQEARKGARDGRALHEKMGEWITSVLTGFARHYRELPNIARWAGVKEQLRKVEAAPQASKERVIRILRHLTDGMNAKDLDLFTRKVVLDDLMWEAEQDHDLPFGFKTTDDVRRERDKVDRALEARPDLRAKVRVRKQVAMHVAQELVDAGVLRPDQIKNPAYYRHQVLDYARAQEKYLASRGQRLKSPYWHRRMGSELDINANLLEAEFEWLHKAFTDVAKADAIKAIDLSEHNVRAETVARAKDSNASLMQDVLDRDMRENGYTTPTGRQTSPVNEAWTSFRQRIAVGLKEIKGTIEAGHLDVPARFRDAAANLLADADEGGLFPMLAWMIETDQPGAPSAAGVFKAINARKAFVKAMLGEKYADPLDIDDLIRKGFAPKGYKAWQPREGRIFFTAKTIPEHVIDRIVGQVAAMTEAEAQEFAPQDLAGAIVEAAQSVRSLFAVGGPRYQMILPDELANTLDQLGDPHADSLLDAIAATPLSLWKRWVLINPRRVIKYNLNNLSGDLDAVIAGNPKAVKKLPQAIKELYQVMLRGDIPSQRYREAVDRGVFDSGLTIQEIPDINYLSEFETLINPPTVKEPVRFALSPLMKVWRGLQRYTWFRENWLRYAAYLDYVERVEDGESMDSIGYGAAKKDVVDAIRDPKDRAALLARELVGDYGNISHWGQGIRRKAIPFWSWMEINTRRYWRFGINAWSQGVGQGLKTTGILGAGLGVRTTAYLGLRMIALYTMVQLWNNLMFGDDEDELSQEERVRLHVNLGRGDDGEIRLLRFQGALSDFLEWINADEAVATLLDIEKGRAGWGDLLTTIAKAPVNRIVGGLTPVIKTPLEYLSGYSFWPDAFKPRAIKDDWRQIARTFSVENEFDYLMGKPSRGYARSLEEAVVYKRDAGENAYNRIKGLAHEWNRREKGIEGSSTYVTPRSRALYEYRLALKFGDREAAKGARERMRELGVTGKDLQRSVKRAHPLGAIALKDRARFKRALDRKERRLLDRAIDWYRDTFQGR